MRIELGEVEVRVENDCEYRTIRAQTLVDGRVGRLFMDHHVTPVENFRRHGAPDKLRHHIDNRLRNGVTRAIIEHYYGE